MSIDPGQFAVLQTLPWPRGGQVPAPKLPGQCRPLHICVGDSPAGRGFSDEAKQSEHAYTYYGYTL